MRQSFLRQLTNLAAQDERVMLLTADLGYMAVEVFADRFPDRFLNVGVAEQNMVAVATGLAQDGFIPFVYSIVPFAVLRPYEFIRNGPVHHRLQVRIIGVGGGFEYGHNGFSHYGLEDLGVMRVLPGLTIVAPADREQTVNALSATWQLEGPVYYRLGKDETRIVPGLEGRFDRNRCVQIGSGSDLLVISIGAISTEAAIAVQRLTKEGVSVSLAIVSTFNDASADELGVLLARFPCVVTVEAHYINGGLGSWVAEVIAERKLPVRLTRCGVRQLAIGQTGSERYMNHLHGLSSEAIHDTAFAALSQATTPA
ncbi:MAG TPA: transketolase C-terminal domain-containing protein [Thermoanaerobaculia bacterium]|nr:transketolase C-terminal domain-containing protein [Thermoanaerobaculia bacterium]